MCAILLGRVIHEGPDCLLRVSHFVLFQNPSEILANISLGGCVGWQPLPHYRHANHKDPKESFVMRICWKSFAMDKSKLYLSRFIYCHFSSICTLRCSLPKSWLVPEHHALFCLSVFAWDACQALCCLSSVYSVFLTWLKHQLLCEAFPNFPPFPQHWLALLHLFKPPYIYTCLILNRLY